MAAAPLPSGAWRNALRRSRSLKAAPHIRYSANSEQLPVEPRVVWMGRLLFAERRTFGARSTRRMLVFWTHQRERTFAKHIRCRDRVSSSSLLGECRMCGATLIRYVCNINSMPELCLVLKPECSGCPVPLGRFFLLSVELIDWLVTPSASTKSLVPYV